MPTVTINVGPPRHPSPYRKAQKISGPTSAHGPTSVSGPELYPPFFLTPSVPGCEWKRPVSWTRAHSQAVRSVRISPLRLPGRPPSPGTAFYHPNSPAGSFHRLRPSPDAAPPVGHFFGALSAPTFEGPLSRGEGVLGAPSIYFCVHACVEDNL
jgi:hypothetical protein